MGKDRSTPEAAAASFGIGHIERHMFLCAGPDCTSEKRGEETWAEVNAWRLSLHQEFDRAVAATALPDRPDYERANAFLVRARLSMVKHLDEHTLEGP